jgi:hypothetical protein
MKWLGSSAPPFRSAVTVRCPSKAMQFNKARTLVARASNGDGAGGRADLIL